jgi:hypothetical protein
MWPAHLALQEWFPLLGGSVPVKSVKDQMRQVYVFHAMVQQEVNPV